MSRYHPECNPDEVFIGNTAKGIPTDLASLKTLRLGKQAFDIYGKKLDPAWYRYCPRTE